MDLREARQKAGLTQAELAERCNLTNVTISTLETGKSTARNGTRKAIEEVLGIRINWLVTRGLRTHNEGLMSTWEHVEQTYRRALLEIKGLQLKERKEFFELAKQYLSEFEESLTATK